jgi:hypothetical protein
LSKYKSREKRTKSRSVDMVAESIVEENMKLKEKVAILEREVERMRRENRASRLSPFE